jgi:hypothetical protein
MGQLSCLGVFLGHVFETELLWFKERVVFVQRGVVEKFARRNAQGLGDGFDDVGGGVLAALLDVAQVTLGDPGFIGESLQSEVAV